MRRCRIACRPLPHRCRMGGSTRPNDNRPLAEIVLRCYASETLTAMPAQKDMAARANRVVLYARVSSNDQGEGRLFPSRTGALTAGLRGPTWHSRRRRIRRCGNGQAIRHDRVKAMLEWLVIYRAITGVEADVHASR